MKRFKKIFRSYRGRHFFSRWTRRFLEKSIIRQFVGLFLILSVFFLSMVTPEALAFVDNLQTTSIIVNAENPIETTTLISFNYPLKSFGISQRFSWFHWGIDLTAPEGTIIYPVAKGKVAEVGSSTFGYGNYILIDHQNGQKSLYAHLSKQEVKTGEEVTIETIIGRIGHTGWATGDHLHLEIYQNGLPLDPSEVLPEK